MNDETIVTPAPETPVMPETTPEVAPTPVVEGEEVAPATEETVVAA